MLGGWSTLRRRKLNLMTPGCDDCGTATHESWPVLSGHGNPSDGGDSNQPRGDTLNLQLSCSIIQINKQERINWKSIGRTSSSRIWGHLEVKAYVWKWIHVHPEDGMSNRGQWWWTTGFWGIWRQTHISGPFNYRFFLVLDPSLEPLASDCRSFVKAFHCGHAYPQTANGTADKPYDIWVMSTLSTRYEVPRFLGLPCSPCHLYPGSVTTLQQGLPSMRKRAIFSGKTTITVDKFYWHSNPEKHICSLFALFIFCFFPGCFGCDVCDFMIFICFSGFHIFFMFFPTYLRWGLSDFMPACPPPFSLLLPPSFLPPSSFLCSSPHPNSNRKLPIRVFPAGLPPPAHDQNLHRQLRIRVFPAGPQP